MRFQSSYLFVLLFFSGAASLGYEIVWIRMLSTVLDHEIIAVLAVVRAASANITQQHARSVAGVGDPPARDAAAIPNGILTDAKK